MYARVRLGAPGCGCVRLCVCLCGVCVVCVGLGLGLGLGMGIGMGTTLKKNIFFQMHALKKPVFLQHENTPTTDANCVNNTTQN